MSPIILVMFAVALCAAGAFATIALARLLPLALLERGNRHGRFAHLGQVEAPAQPARRAVRASRQLAAGNLRLV